jgi:hypothetical protein
MISEQEELVLLSKFKNIPKYKHLQFSLLKRVTEDTMMYTIVYKNEFNMLTGLIDFWVYDKFKVEICFRYHPLQLRCCEPSISAITSTIRCSRSPRLKLYEGYFKNKLLSQFMCCVQCGTTFFAALSGSENVYSCESCRGHKEQLIKKLESYTFLNANIILLVLSLL